MRYAVMLLGCLCAGVTAPAPAGTVQEHVHSMSHEVMPFDVAKTWHVFRMTESGGTQKVVIRDAVFVDQVAPIRQHLLEEAARFQRGDYADPSHLHGAAMPGLGEMQAAAGRIRVTYRDLPDGAELAFETSDLAGITAIHRWFGSQLSEHGADAKAE
jgi:hypothetical protein